MSKERFQELALGSLSDEEYDVFNAFFLKAGLDFGRPDDAIGSAEDLRAEIKWIQDNRLAGRFSTEEEFEVPAFDEEADFVSCDLTGETRSLHNTPVFVFYR